MVVATDHLSKRDLEMEVLLIRGEGICLEAAFGELAHCSHLNLFEVMKISYREVKDYSHTQVTH